MFVLDFLEHIPSVWLPRKMRMREREIVLPGLIFRSSSFTWCFCSLKIY